MPPHPGLSPHAHALASHALVSSSAPKADHSTLDHNHRWGPTRSPFLSHSSNYPFSRPFFILLRGRPDRAQITRVSRAYVLTVIFPPGQSFISPTPHSDCQVCCIFRKFYPPLLVRWITVIKIIQTIFYPEHGWLKFVCSSFLNLRE